MPLLKILNVSERTGMSVVPTSSKFFVRKTYRWPVYTDVHWSTAPRTAVVLISSVFALQTRRYKMYREVHFIPCLWDFFTVFLVSTPSISKGLRKGCSEPPRMAVFTCSNKFACKLVARKCARMYICGRGWRYFVDLPNAVVFLLKQKARNFQKISCEMMAIVSDIFDTIA